MQKPLHQGVTRNRLAGSSRLEADDIAFTDLRDAQIENACFAFMAQVSDHPTIGVKPLRPAS